MILSWFESNWNRSKGRLTVGQLVSSDSSFKWKWNIFKHEVTSQAKKCSISATQIREHSSTSEKLNPKQEPPGRWTHLKVWLTNQITISHLNGLQCLQVTFSERVQKTLCGSERNARTTVQEEFVFTLEELPKLSRLLSVICNWKIVERNVNGWTTGKKYRKYQHARSKNHPKFKELSRSDLDSFSTGGRGSRGALLTCGFLEGGNMLLIEICMRNLFSNSRKCSQELNAVLVEVVLYPPTPGGAGGAR